MNMSFAKNIVIICALCTLGNAHAVNLSKCVGSVQKVMSDSKKVTFWGYAPVGGMGGGCNNVTIPAAPIDVVVGDTLTLKLNVGMMTPVEQFPYNGHTIHLHGADVNTRNDGVPDTNALTRTTSGKPDPFVNGDTYSFTPTSNMSGSYMYHCHVHTVKHLEMGMYGPLIVRPQDPSNPGAFLKQITDSPNTAYAFEKTYLFSTVDPDYHTAVQDDPIFADYNPRYFLLNGAEGINLVNGVENNSSIPNMNDATSLSAVTLVAKPSSKVALRLIGLHSVLGTFEIKNAAGVLLDFTVYVQDGRAYTIPETVKTLDIAPAQRFDVIFTTPAGTGTVYPQITYKTLRDRIPYLNGPANRSIATIYGKVTF